MAVPVFREGMPSPLDSTCAFTLVEEAELAMLSLICLSDVVDGKGKLTPRFEDELPVFESINTASEAVLAVTSLPTWGVVLKVR